MDFNVLFQSCVKNGLVTPLHSLVHVCGRAHNLLLSTKLVSLYARKGDFRLARLVFDQIPRKNIYSWNSLISGYVKNFCYREAVHCYNELIITTKLRPDFFTFPIVLKSCEKLKDGMRMHSWILKLGLENDVYIGSSLLHLYSEFGDLDDACRLFNEMSTRDLGAWNSMLSAFCQNGKAAEAVDVFEDMKFQVGKVDSVTVSSILPACAPLNDLLLGSLIHVYSIKFGLANDTYAANALINMYAKVGHVEQAKDAFYDMEARDIVTWNSMIAAYEQNEDPMSARILFSTMTENGFDCDVLTLLSLASITAQCADTHGAQSVHGYGLRRGWVSWDISTANAIIDMYAKLSMADCAKRVFYQMPAKDRISWNTLIMGLAQNGLADDAIKLYYMMDKCGGIGVDQGTLVNVLPAFSLVGALHQGKAVHGKIVKIGLQCDAFVGTCLVDMHAKCGRLNEARQLFEQVPKRVSVPWNAIISCLAIHGHGKDAIILFTEMQQEGVVPDSVTFVSLLSACSHAGLINEGQKYFNMMRTCYGIEPCMKHYTCMVDLLGRAGHLYRAYELIRTMSLIPDATVWGALLGACRIHGDVELGIIASCNVFEIDKQNVGYYIVLSNIFARVGEWEGMEKVRALAKSRGLKKNPGWSSIEINNKVHVFFTGSQNHPRCIDIYKELRVLSARLKSLGYVPDFSFVLHDVEEDEKDHILMSHSERLALAFGIIATPLKTSIQIFKNLRICGDCHIAIKLISLITERQIIVRDSNRFHHFSNGNCSCGDYW